MKTKFSQIIIAALFFCATTNLFSQQNAAKIIDSLEQVLATGNLSDEETLKCYNEISGLHNYNPQKAMQYARQGLRLAEKKGNKKMLFEFYYVLSNIYYNLANYDSSLVCCEKVVELYPFADAETKESLLGFTFKSMGEVYSWQGNFDKALEYFFSSIKIAEDIDNKKLLLYTYSSIAYMYASMQNLEQAESYFVKMKDACIEINDSLNIAYVLYQLSVLHTNKNEYDKALQDAEDAYRIVTSYSNVSPNYLIQSLTVLSSAWSHFDTNKALKYAKEALSLTETHNLYLHQSTILYEIARLYYDLNNYSDSELTALQALDEVDKDHYLQNLLYEILLQSNIMLGKKDKALEYFDIYQQSIADYSQENFQSSLSEMEVKYETEKKEMQITLLKEEKQLMTWLSIAIGGLLLLGLITLFFIWRWTLYKKRLAEQQVKQLSQEKQLIATQAILDGETAERTRIARDLHDGLGGVLTGAKLHFLDMKQDVNPEYIDAERFDKVLRLLDQSVQEMRRVAHHLMPDSLSRFGLKPAVSDFCSNLPAVEFIYYGDEIRLEPKLEEMIYRCIYELVNNALKHAGASNIIVQIMQRSNSIAFTVQDDGCGFDPSAESKGIGLANIRTRVAAYNGNFNIDSSADKGTEANVELQL